jgi:hypothetical protein
MKNSYLNFTTLHITQDKVPCRYYTSLPELVLLRYLRDYGAIAVLCQPLGQLLVQLLFSFHLRNTIINFKKLCRTILKSAFMLQIRNA